MHNSWRRTEQEIVPLLRHESVANNGSARRPPRGASRRGAVVGAAVGVAAGILVGSLFRNTAVHGLLQVAGFLALLILLATGIVRRERAEPGWTMRTVKTRRFLLFVAAVAFVSALPLIAALVIPGSPISLWQ